jgi:hypothetical protein
MCKYLSLKEVQFFGKGNIYLSETSQNWVGFLARRACCGHAGLVALLRNDTDFAAFR